MLMTGKIAYLEQTKALQILIALLDGPKHFRKLNLMVGGSTNTVNRAVENLKKAGLVQETYQEIFPFSRIFSLTPVGEKVAKMVKQIADLLEQS